MKTAIFYTSDVDGQQLGWGRPFIDGLRRHGWRANIANRVEKADLFVLWGARRIEVIEKAKARGSKVVVLERAYIDDRFKWVSVSFGGGLNGCGKFYGPFQDASRWDKYFSDLMRPWIDRTLGYVLLMEQIATDTAVRNVDLPAFYAKVRTAFENGNRAVRMRRHPNVNPKHGQQAIDLATSSLMNDLNGACCAITWNSNSGVDAVLAGIPTVAMDRGSMAWDVTGHELKMPPKPDRAAWAHALAWKQWRKEELSSGYCWEMIRGDL